MYLIKTQLLFYFSLFSYPLVAAEILDYDMNGSEKKKTGIYKLTDKEKATLQKWIDTHYIRRVEPLPQEIGNKHAILQENLRNGQFIRLSDHTLWNISPEDTPISQGWITPAEIIVSQSGAPEYPYRLTHSLTGSSLKARKAENLTELNLKK